MSSKEVVQSALNGKLDDLKELFASSMNETLAVRLNERKQEIAKSYFGKKNENA